MPADGELYKLVLLEGPCKSAFQEYLLKGEKVYIGRKDKEKSIYPDVDFSNDMEVSRKHARLFCEEKEWFIENEQEYNSTKINGKAISAKTVLKTGDVVRMGKTAFAFVLEKQFAFYFNNALIYGQHFHYINYALLCSKLKFIRKLTLKNPTNEKSIPFVIELHIRKYSRPCMIPVPSLAPLETREMYMPAVEFLPDSLRCIIGCETAILSITTGSISLHEDKLAVLSPWMWRYDLYKPETISVYVPSGQNRIIESIVAETGVKTENGLDGIEKSNKKKETVRKIYDYLKDNKCIEYEHPNLKPDKIQKIRSPHHIFNPYSRNLSGCGTCIDLTLLLAGCLMSAEIKPVVIFAGREEGIPLHVFLGLWPGNIHGGGTLLKDDDMAGLVMLECTGFSSGTGIEGKKKSFDEAVESARKIYRESAWKCGVDVCVTREKPFEMVSMDFELEPEVWRIYKEAEEFAREKRKEKIETTHLFYAVLKACGDVTMKVFNEAGINMDEITKKINEKTDIGNFTGRPRLTDTNTIIQELARGFADRMGSLTVREQDLLYALFKRYKMSKTLCDYCEEFEIKVGRLLDILKNEYEDPGNPTNLFNV